MKDIDICCGEYASKWSLTDFYDESEQKLMDALESDEDFDTGWWGCKKEIRYARIVREGSQITVEVSCQMDDMWDSDDLIYDALWDEFHIEDELPDDIIDSIRDTAIYEIDDHTSASSSFPVSGSSTKDFASIVGAIDTLETECESNNDQMFEQLRSIVSAHIEYMRQMSEEEKDWGKQHET